MKVIAVVFYFALAYSKEIDTDIRTVHVIFRHGMRYPNGSELYPKDPYRHYFPEKVYSILTEKGKTDSYSLGQFLRERYNQLIGPKYNKKNILATSTPTNRTIMTTQLVLEGLFQNSLNRMLSDHFDWDELPYEIRKEHLGINVYNENTYCPAFDNEYKRVMNSSDYEKLMEQYSDLINYINSNTGLTINNLQTANGFYQMLKIEDSMGLLLPEWAQKIYPDKVHKFATSLMTLINYNVLLRRLNGGKLLRIIIDNVFSYINNNKNEDEPKIYLLSGHDMTVASVLSALEMFKPHVPKYNSAVIFELHQEKITKQYLTKIFYLKGVNLDLEELYIERCPNACPFEDFVKAVKLNTVDNADVECNNN